MGGVAGMFGGHHGQVRYGDREYDAVWPRKLWLTITTAGTELRLLEPWLQRDLQRSRTPGLLPTAHIVLPRLDINPIIQPVGAEST
jgi:hypothetical protein